MVQEELHWKQRAKIFWLKDGDLNTRFFHALAKERNRIKSLSDDHGNIHSTPDELCQVVFDYFENLFSHPAATHDISDVIDVVDEYISDDVNAMLMAPFSADDFKKALFHMKVDKSPD